MGVSPFIVPKSHPIGTTNHSTNIVNITSRNLVSSSYIGPGTPLPPARQATLHMHHMNTHKSTHVAHSKLSYLCGLWVCVGAGRYPTANSVVNDVVRLARGLVGKPFPVEREVRSTHAPSAPPP